MSTGDTSPTRSLDRANDPEIFENDVRLGAASSDAGVSQEITNSTAGDSHFSLIFQ